MVGFFFVLFHFVAIKINNNKNKKKKKNIKKKKEEGEVEEKNTISKLLFFLICFRNATHNNNKIAFSFLIFLYFTLVSKITFILHLINIYTHKTM